MWTSMAPAGELNSMPETINGLIQEVQKLKITFKALAGHLLEG